MFETKNIEEFLQHYEDYWLDELQKATQDGRLEYNNRCGCLVHFFKGDYESTKTFSQFRGLAARAEREFMMLGYMENDGQVIAGIVSEESQDARRRAAVFPLIVAEENRRKATLMPVTFKSDQREEVRVK